MTHDIESLLEIIRQLELRIIQLEVRSVQLPNAEDGWYFEY